MAYKTFVRSKVYSTQYRLEFITISQQLQDYVNESGIINGSLTVQTLHTTCCLWINENEKNLIGQNNEEFPGDLKRILDRFAPPKEWYGHNDVRDANNPEGIRDTHLCEPKLDGSIPECINGHSHAQALMLPHSLTIIIKDGKLLLGQWQQVMLVELDHDRPRTISVLVQGDDAETNK